MKYKKPESVLVVIFCSQTQRCLMLQRDDDPDFWQSVTGSLETGELPVDTAHREVKEETGIDIANADYSLFNAHHCVEFEIFPQFKHRYAPGITTNKEHWFYLNLPNEIDPILTEHINYQWLSFEKAAKLTPSWNNRQAIEQIQRVNHENNG